MKPLYSGHHRDLKIVSVTERCPLERYFTSWLILLQKLILVCCGIVQLNPKCVERSVLGDEQA